MKIMRKLYDQCMEELEGTIEYCNCATCCKNNSDLAKMYVNMAKQELEHAETLHSMSKKLAESKLGEKVDPMLMEL
jgi:rubrerythrin